MSIGHEVQHDPAQMPLLSRQEVFQLMVELLTDELVVCNLGHPAQELFVTGDRDRNFYMLGSMGMASSIGLGLAVSSRNHVVAIDGDAAVTMNLGSLVTIGHLAPRNYTLVIIDNGANGSTGFQPSFTAERLDLAAVAAGCGIPSVHVLAQPEQIRSALLRCTRSGSGPHVLIVKTSCRMLGPLEPVALGPLDIRDRFQRHITQV